MNLKGRTTINGQLYSVVVNISDTGPKGYHPGDYTLQEDDSKAYDHLQISMTPIYADGQTGPYETMNYQVSSEDNDLVVTHHDAETPVYGPDPAPPIRDHYPMEDGLSKFVDTYLPYNDR